MQDNQTSPTSSIPINGSQPLVQSPEIDFYEAIRQTLNGAKITKLEWKNKTIYCFLDPNAFTLKILKEDGKSYDWIISEGDIVGKDWIVL